MKLWQTFRDLLLDRDETAFNPLYIAFICLLLFLLVLWVTR